MAFQRAGGLIQCDAGWAIQARGRTQVKYIEEARVALFSCELLADGSVALFPAGTKEWLRPSHEPITLEQRDLLVSRIVDALGWSGTKTQVF